MKRIFRFLLTLLFIVSFVGCTSNKTIDGGKSSPTAESEIMGYVMQIENGRILVINSEAKDFSSTGGIKEFYDAIWFSNAPRDIKVGDKVKVWYDIVMDSYPGQSEVKRIEVIPSQKPNGATLTESQALNKVLPSQKIVAVKSINYDNQTDIWNIQLKDTMSDQIYYVQVADK